MYLRFKEFHDFLFWFFFNIFNDLCFELLVAFPIIHDVCIFQYLLASSVLSEFTFDTDFEHQEYIDVLFLEILNFDVQKLNIPSTEQWISIDGDFLAFIKTILQHLHFGIFLLPLWFLGSILIGSINGFSIFRIITILIYFDIASIKTFFPLWILQLFFFFIRWFGEILLCFLLDTEELVFLTNHRVIYSFYLFWKRERSITKSSE